MIAVDSNLLVYAHREDSPLHAPLSRVIVGLAEGRAPWGIPWPCLHEFLAVTTHPRIYAPPTPLASAVAQIEAWLESPGLVLLAEDEAYWPRLRALVLDGKISGPKVHDARIAAICLQQGVEELWTVDRDFSRFPALRVRNPLKSA
jgi:uncharacterized protein